MLRLHVTRTAVSREAAKWGIFHRFSQDTMGQEKVYNADQTVSQAIIPTEFYHGNGVA